MRILTVLNAYRLAKGEKENIAVARRKGHEGILVDDDPRAREYQRRDRQAAKFLAALYGELERTEAIAELVEACYQLWSLT